MSSILDRDTINAFCRHTHAEARGAASGPLKGLAFAAKDIYDVAGHRTGFGSPDWLGTHDAAARTAPVVQQLLAAGADLAGKTHTDELTYSLTGENAHYGTPVNVSAPGRIPGGSSSGSAAAVAAGLVAFALGSDTGGSVRAPASFCGLYGLRPTHGRVSLEGACPLAASFDTCGWFARDAALLERVGRVLLGRAQPPSPGRLLLADDAFALLKPRVGEALRGAVERVSARLGAPQRMTVSAEGLPAWFDVFRTLQGAEIWAQHGAWVQRVSPQLGPGVKQRMAWAATVQAGDAAAARAQRETIAQRMDALLAGNAVLMLPTVPDIAPLREAPPQSTDDFRARAMSLLCIAGLARLPQLNLPYARLDGCPLGLSLIGPRGDDEMLLAVARELECPSAA
jgi:amidase